MMMRMTLSDFIEICKFNEAINRDMEEDFYDDIEEDDEEYWNDLRNDDFIKEAYRERHLKEAKAYEVGKY